MVICLDMALLRHAVVTMQIATICLWLHGDLSRRGFLMICCGDHAHSWRVSEERVIYLDVYSRGLTLTLWGCCGL